MRSAQLKVNCKCDAFTFASLLSLAADAALPQLRRPPLDDAARSLFAGASWRVRVILTIVRINPGEADRARDWLDGGAPPEVAYRLRPGAPRA
ncbi:MULTISPECIES: hypothetical protein [Sorangium]|uniref:Uncharacterized protein n=1 Tax=Sorangium cellulosum TaxID=56 RepID=A0A4P2R7V2_SORCE|nr:MULTISPECIES: hypothetical protein [Sorangium]AUX38163.1 uncharacterized protein SOCE836_104030 [Sorangium cellulosum]WCQ97451.1 hypothetical protein NQZ70_10245 [Sorangium sp. Soce836]